MIHKWKQNGGFYDDDGKLVHCGWKSNLAVPNIYEDDFIFVYYIIRTECTRYYEQYWHYNKGFEINIITGGKAIFNVEDKTYFVSHKDVVVTRENEKHYCFPIDDSSFNMLCMAFDFKRSPETAQEKLLYDGFYNLPFAEFGDVEAAADVHEKIIRILKAESRYRDSLICHSVYEFLFLLLSSVESKTNSRPEPLLSAKIKDYIDSNLDKKLYISQIAKVFLFSESYITKVFKRETGMSLQQYYVHAKLEHARTALIETDLPVTDIALQQGYPNVHYFCKIFKEHYQMTPKEFRERF